MANSATVAALNDILASQYNNLRLDVLDLTTGHTHDGTNGRNTGFSLAGLTVASGGATITAGNLGIGTAQAGNVGVRITGAILSGSTQSFSLLADATHGSGATTSGEAVRGQVVTAAATFTMDAAYAFRVLDASKGTNSIITSQYGLHVASLTAGGTNNYGIYVNAPSGGSGSNIGLYNAGTTTLAGALTVTTGGIAVTGNSAFGASVSTTNALLVSTAESSGASADVAGIQYNGLLTKTANTGNMAGYQGNAGCTVNGSVTCTRFAQALLYGATATVTGTLTDHNTLYLGTPVNGSTVRVVDTASGGYLTTGGVWTDNVSWAALKRDITPVTIQEQTALLNWFATDYKPVRYRYADTYETVLEDDGSTRQALTCYERDDVDYPHLGFLLDDLPQSLREIVCADTSGGISGKDVGGLALALLQVSAQRIRSLEARLAKAGIN